MGRVEDAQPVQDGKLAAVERLWGGLLGPPFASWLGLVETGPEDEYVDRSTGERGDDVDLDLDLDLDGIESDRLLAEPARRLAAERDAQQ